MIIRGTNISMTRGDSESLTVTLTDATFSAGDTLYLTVRPRVDDDIVLQKIVTEFTGSDAVFIFDPGDTEGLDFGKYIYDIQLTQADGTVTTLVKPKQDNFELTEEVTY